ncbi:MAG: helix-turn-helix domain-containing protein [Butyrivibrio sp.]|nr:helix-turn-helix domain-containing protein [Butyrivibrio sp.]
MNILIVDDEYYSAKSTQRKISTHYQDKFEQVLCAFSMEQALKILSSIDISIMICDIEMPGGSGLSLLSEIRSKQYDVVCIFLTAYAKFEYVSEALKLNSIDYLLKPVEDTALFEAVDKAVDQYTKNLEIKQSMQEAENFNYSKLEIEGLFWTELINGNLEAEYQSIYSDRKRRGLDEINTDSKFIVLLVHTILHSSEIPMEKGLFDFVIKNILGEYFYNSDELQIISRPENNIYILFLPADIRACKDVIERCKEAMNDFVPQFPLSFNFYVAKEPVTIDRIPETAQNMIAISKKNVTHENYIFDLSQNITPQDASTSLNIPEAHWNDLLLRRDTDSLISETEIFLTGLRHSEKATRDTLRLFYQSFFQMVSSSLDNKSKEIKDIFNSKVIQYHEDEITSSFYHIREWIQNILTAYDECLNSDSDSSNTVAEVRAYIKEHLDDDLSRENLSKLVYLNPDYLSHLFKKEVGLSLTNYVIKERIEESKRLLSNTDMSIQDIAIKCGFQNISYFSRQFKTLTGMTPREFRK